MSHSEAQLTFLTSEKARRLYIQLEDMVNSPRYNTKVAGLDSDPYGVRFIEKHMDYMSRHRTMDHRQYIANLKIMMKIEKRL